MELGKHRQAWQMPWESSINKSIEAIIGLFFLKKEKMKLTLATMQKLIESAMTKEEIIRLYVKHGYSSAAASLMWCRVAIKLNLMNAGDNTYMHWSKDGIFFKH